MFYNSFGRYHLRAKASELSCSHSVTGPKADHPERFYKELDPEYQQKEYDRILADIKKRYGNALEQLKYL